MKFLNMILVMVRSGFSHEKHFFKDKSIFLLFFSVIFWLDIRSEHKSAKKVNLYKYNQNVNLIWELSWVC